MIRKKKYKIRINCCGSQIIEVEAATLEEAKEEALKIFNCQGSEGEFGEVIK